MTLLQSSLQPFSEVLREQTQTAHRAAEQQPFVMALMSGRLPGEAYVDYLAQLWRVYWALEESRVLVADDPVVAGFVDERLHRVGAIEADLETMVGSRWRQVLPSSSRATTDYVARIWRSVEDPCRWVSHHYVRYLGDLSGGQVIAAMLRRHYGMGSDELSFYAFEGLTPPVVKREYRTRLDTADWAPEQRAAVVEEALAAYDANTAVFASLDHWCGS